MDSKRLLLLVLAIFMFVGCKKKPEEIFIEEKSGVVLICNQFYYDITLANGNHIYFTGLDKDGDFEGLTNNLSEVRSKPAILNGTGFFIDPSGKILTNRHVVAPEVDKETVRNNVNSLIGLYAAYIEALQDSLSERYDAIKEYADSSVSYDDWGNVYTLLSSDEINVLSQEMEKLKKEYAYADSVKLNVRSNILGYNFTIQLHSQFGIAYDGSSVKSWNDFMKQPCEILRVSQDVGSDLALLQLNTKLTPTDRYVFKIGTDGGNNGASLEINQQVYMIGYNQGITLAQTSNGINAQFTSGTVTQQPDGNRVLYSIPAMQGSSGSPVVDDRGRLVAVNFASMRGSDNFNFGVPLLRVLTFIK